jgi:hypothetical protein
MGNLEARMGVEPIYTALQAVLALTNQRVSSAPHFAPHEFVAFEVQSAVYHRLLLDIPRRGFGLRFVRDLLGKLHGGFNCKRLRSLLRHRQRDIHAAITAQLLL